MLTENSAGPTEQPVPRPAPQQAAPHTVFIFSGLAAVLLAIALFPAFFFVIAAQPQRVNTYFANRSNADLLLAIFLIAVDVICYNLRKIQAELKNRPPRINSTTAVMPKRP